MADWPSQGELGCDVLLVASHQSDKPTDLQIKLSRSGIYLPAQLSPPSKTLVKYGVYLGGRALQEQTPQEHL